MVSGNCQHPVKPHPSGVHVKIEALGRSVLRVLRTFTINHVLSFATAQPGRVPKPAAGQPSNPCAQTPKDDGRNGLAGRSSWTGTWPVAAGPWRYLALNLPRTRVHGRPFWSLAGKTNGVSGVWETRSGIVVTRAHVNSKTPLSLVDNGGQDKRVIGFEPTTFTLATCGRWVLRHDAPKTYGASQVTLHFSLPKGDEVVQRTQHGVARCDLRTHRCDPASDDSSHGHEIEARRTDSGYGARSTLDIGYAYEPESWNAFWKLAKSRRLIVPS